MGMGITEDTISQLQDNNPSDLKTDKSLTDFAITTTNLTYVFPNKLIGLRAINLQLPWHTRTVLIGANGAGKSTLLRLLAGKTLAKAGGVKIGGEDPFRGAVEGLTYLGTEWASNSIVRHDIPVSILLSSVGGDYYTERREQLIDILDIDIEWRMHAVSDGERRRVQLAMGLMKPWNLLLLDEITVDLDVLVRTRLLNFLEQETKGRKCAVVYATHIFDGLQDWPTNVVHMHMSEVIHILTLDEALIMSDKFIESGNGKFGHDKNGSSKLLTLALYWLSDDLKKRGTRIESRSKRSYDEVKKQNSDYYDAADERINRYFRMTRS